MVNRDYLKLNILIFIDHLIYSSCAHFKEKYTLFILDNFLLRF